MGIFGSLNKGGQEDDEAEEVRMYCDHCKRTTLHRLVWHRGHWAYQCKGCGNISE